MIKTSKISINKKFLCLFIEPSITSNCGLYNIIFNIFPRMNRINHICRIICELIGVS